MRFHRMRNWRGRMADALGVAGAFRSTLDTYVIYSGGSVTPNVAGWTVAGSTVSQSAAAPWVVKAVSPASITALTVGFHAGAFGTFVLDRTSSLATFSVTQCALAALPASLPPSLTSLTLSNCGATAFALALPPALATLTLASNNMTSFTPALPATLTTLNLSGNGLTAIQAMPSLLTTANLSANGLTQSAVDGVLAQLVANGKSNGTADVSGSNDGLGLANATPSAAGLASKATLVARGWTVSNN